MSARYGRRVENYRLPKTDAARAALAAEIGADGRQLLGTVDAAADRPDLARLPEVVTLQALWAQQYVEAGGGWRWRAVDDMPPPATMLSSPSDPEARFSRKRETEWVGYTRTLVQLTETCDADAPRRITHVETTPATTPDDGIVPVVHAALAARDLLPAEHLVDKGYTDAKVLADSQREHGVHLFGPVADDPSWQARAGAGFAKAHFAVDWARQVVRCLAGKESHAWIAKLNAVARWLGTFDHYTEPEDVCQRLTMGELEALLAEVRATRQWQSFRRRRGWRRCSPVRGRVLRYSLNESFGLIALADGAARTVSIRRSTAVAKLIPELVGLRGGRRVSSSDCATLMSSELL